MGFAPRRPDAAPGDRPLLLVAGCEGGGGQPPRTLDGSPAGSARHKLSLAANRHFSITLLNEAIADLVNAHAELDISQAWGDGSTVAADGTYMDTCRGYV